MLAPVLITPPTDLPVSLDEVKRHLREDFADDDPVLELLLRAAVDRLDGWRGLGIAIVTQTWRQDYPSFDRRCLRIPLGPVASITSITYVDGNKTTQTLAADQYRLLRDARGHFIVPADDVTWPATDCRPDAVAVTYVAGVEAANVPASLKAAILMLVGHFSKNREAVLAGDLAAVPLGVDWLTGPHSRVGI